MRKILTVLIAAGLVASACSDDPLSTADDGFGDDIIIDVGGQEVVLTSSLSGFADCDSLLSHLRAEGAERVGPYGFNDGWYGGPVPAAASLTDDMAVDQAVAADGAAGSETSGAAPVNATEDRAEAATEGVDFSGTNLQEVGVDEADIVKTDGERIYIVARGELIVVDVSERAVIGSVQLRNSEQSELFLSGNEILHVSYGWGYFGPVVMEGDAEADFARDGDVEFIEEEYWDGPRTIISRISVSDAGDPEILESLTVDGDYVSSRAVDGVARVVIRSNPQHNFPFVYPAGSAGEDRATDSNRDAILDSELTDWLPAYELTDAGGTITDAGLLPACEQVHAPTEFAGFGVLSVLTVAVDGSIDPAANSSVLAPGSVVYSSPGSIYVATSPWFDSFAFDDVDWQEINDNRQTSIHRFDISSPESAAYTASGSVPGDVRDSFSMSEHEGDLRVVTTTGDAWDDTSETSLRVLRETEGELVEIGSVGNMGRGEAVQSVRFQGEVAYVVTFEQTDPLYTLDLTDPENPQVRGELKIPGFSSYLHPIGDGLVLGVGSDADDSGVVRGSKVSLFDVSDLDNPLEIDTWVGPDGWNNVGWDTHAFLWWAPENLAVVPMETWQGGRQWAGAVVLEVDDRTIIEVGRIDHVDEDGEEPGQSECQVIGDEVLPTTEMDEFTTELEYVIAEEGALVLLCNEGEQQSATGFDCYAEPYFTEEAERLGIPLGDAELVTCWNNNSYIPQITRSIVLEGNELWTVSSTQGWLNGQADARLQVNDLIGLDRLDVVRL